MANEHTQQALFRKKSLDRVSSPEQLNEYIRVTNPSLWVVLAAIVILLVGVCVWGVLGRLDTVLPVAAVAEEGTLTVYVKEADIDAVAVGMTVTVEGQTCTVTQIPGAPFAVDGQLNEYALHVGGLQNGQWVYPVVTDGVLADGTYSAGIVVESIAPMSFLVN